MLLRPRVLFVVGPEIHKIKAITKNQFLEWIQFSLDLTLHLYKYTQQNEPYEFPDSNTYSWFGSNIDFTNMFETTGKLYLSMKRKHFGDVGSDWISLLDLNHNDIYQAKELDEIPMNTTTLKNTMLDPVMTSVILIDLNYFLKLELNPLTLHKNPAEIQHFGYFILPIHVYSIFILFHFSILPYYGTSQCQTRWTLCYTTGQKKEENVSFFQNYSEMQKNDILFVDSKRVKKYVFNFFEKKVDLIILFWLSWGLRLNNTLST